MRHKRYLCTKLLDQVPWYNKPFTFFTCNGEIKWKILRVGVFFLKSLNENLEITNDFFR